MEIGDERRCCKRDRRNLTASGDNQVGDRSMGFCGRPAGRRLLVLLVFVATITLAGAKIAVKDAPAGDVQGIGAKLQAGTCRPIDPCRGAVANQLCCKAINAAIVTEGGCGCVCKVLKIYGAPKLPAACNRIVSTCPKCGSCPCS